MLGVDANYSLDMESHGARWKWESKEEEIFTGMQRQGVRWLRVRLWTSDEGPSGKTYARKMVERATKAELRPYLAIFLSDNWADLMKQPSPAIWRTLPLGERVEAVQRYSRDVVADLRQHGLTSHVYEIGNEIDYGICGVFASKSDDKRPQNLPNRIWPQAAQIVRSCERGVKEADPEAKFILHIAHWWDADFCIAFFNSCSSNMWKSIMPL